MCKQVYFVNFVPEEHKACFRMIGLVEVLLFLCVVGYFFNKSRYELHLVYSIYREVCCLQSIDNKDLLSIFVGPIGFFPEVLRIPMTVIGALPFLVFLAELV